MQKKCLLFVMVSSCVVQVCAMGDQHNNQEDRFAQLRDDLRILRNGKDNAIYAEVMVAGLEAIDKVKQEQIKLIEKNRVERKDGVSSNRSNWGKERPGTLVDIEDTKIDTELNEYKERHGKLADIYTGYTLYMHNDLSIVVQQDLEAVLPAFKTMERALRECPLGDQLCYDQYGAPLYSKMADQNYRRTIQENHYNMALKAAHDKKIPVTDSELRAIIRKNEACKKTMAEIEARNNSIDDLVNPEKIKEREEKKIRDLEAQRVKEQEEKVQELKDQLQQGNVSNDSDKD